MQPALISIAPVIPFSVSIAACHLSSRGSFILANSTLLGCGFFRRAGLKPTKLATYPSTSPDVRPSSPVSPSNASEVYKVPKNDVVVLVHHSPRRIMNGNKRLERILDMKSFSEHDSSCQGPSRRVQGFDGVLELTL